jgi:hypothetical protein
MLDGRNRAFWSPMALVVGSISTAALVPRPEQGSEEEHRERSQNEQPQPLEGLEDYVRAAHMVYRLRR